MSVIFDQSLASSPSTLLRAALEGVGQPLESGRTASFRELEVHCMRVALGSPADALRLAQRGLQALYGAAKFERGGASVPLGDACDAVSDNASVPQGRAAFGTQTIDGEAKFVPPSCAGLEAEASAIVARGAAEDGLVDIARKLERSPEWTDLRADSFVVLGGLARVGLTRELLRRGATVYVVDLVADHSRKQHQSRWAELIECARRSCGKLLLPERSGCIGADLIADLPEIAVWCARARAGTVVNLVRCDDSRAFFYAEAAADALIEYVSRVVPETALAHLCEPFEVYAVPESSQSWAQMRYAERAWWHEALRVASVGSWCAPNEAERVDEKAMTGAGGVHGSAIRSAKHWGRDTRSGDVLPRFLLLDCEFSGGTRSSSRAWHSATKLVQRWRATVGRQIGTYVQLSDKCTHRVSANVLPLARGPVLPRFGLVPMDDTTQARWAALLLVRDMRDVESPANPTLRLDNPQLLFAHSTALHGGAWRCAFRLDSVTGLSLALAVIRAYLGPTISAALVAAVLVRIARSPR